MNVLKGKLVEGDRLIVPETVRKAMGLGKDDDVLMELHGDELRVRSAQSALRRIQEKLRPYAPSRSHVSDELIAERRAEAARE